MIVCHLLTFRGHFWPLTSAKSEEINTSWHFYIRPWREILTDQSHVLICCLGAVCWWLLCTPIRPANPTNLKQLKPQRNCFSLATVKATLQNVACIYSVQCPNSCWGCRHTHIFLLNHVMSLEERMQLCLKEETKPPNTFLIYTISTVGSLMQLLWYSYRGRRPPDLPSPPRSVQEVLKHPIKNGNH